MLHRCPHPKVLHHTGTARNALTPPLLLTSHAASCSKTGRSVWISICLLSLYISVFMYSFIVLFTVFISWLLACFLLTPSVKRKDAYNFNHVSFWCLTFSVLCMINHARCCLMCINKDLSLWTVLPTEVLASSIFPVFQEVCHLSFTISAG